MWISRKTSDYYNDNKLIDTTKMYIFWINQLNGLNRERGRHRSCVNTQKKKVHTQSTLITSQSGVCRKLCHFCQHVLHLINQQNLIFMLIVHLHNLFVYKILFTAQVHGIYEYNPTSFIFSVMEDWFF